MSEYSQNALPAQRYIETPGTDIRDNFLYVQETGLMKSLDSHKSHREKMDSYLIVYVLSGEGEFTYLGKHTKVYPGGCIFIHCENSYTHETQEKNAWEFLWVHCNGASADKLYDYFCQRSENIFYPENPMKTADIMRDILINTREKSPNYELRNHMLLTALLTELITCEKRQKKPFHQISTEQKLWEVRAYLDKNFTQPCSLDSLSQEFYMSKYYLSREFKRHFGEGISSYLAKLRITRAKELLRFSSMRTGEIATACGINDSNHFLKVFKKAEGMTPTEFRKKWRE